MSERSYHGATSRSLSIQITQYITAVGFNSQCLLCWVDVKYTTYNTNLRDGMFVLHDTESHSGDILITVEQKTDKASCNLSVI